MMIILVFLTVLHSIAGNNVDKCPFTGALACKEWEIDRKIKFLEKEVKEIKHLKTEFSSTKSALTLTQNELSQTKSQLANTQNELSQTKSQLANTQNELSQTKSELSKTRRLVENHLSHKSSWQLKRIKMALPKLTKLRLHGVTPTIDEPLPLPFPKNTRAIIVVLYCNFFNNNGHAYLVGSMKQKDAGQEGVVEFLHRHHNVYANTWREEYLMPWSTDGTNALQVKVNESVSNHGTNNYFTFSVVGYITAA